LQVASHLRRQGQFPSPLQGLRRGPEHCLEPFGPDIVLSFPDHLQGRIGRRRVTVMALLLARLNA